MLVQGQVAMQPAAAFRAKTPLLPFKVAFWSWFYSLQSCSDTSIRKCLWHSQDAGIGIGECASLCTDSKSCNLLAVKQHRATSHLALTDVVHLRSRFLCRSNRRLTPKAPWVSKAAGSHGGDPGDPWFWCFPFIVYVGCCAMHSGSAAVRFKRRGVVLGVVF